MEAFDESRREHFLKIHGFGRSRRYFLRHNGKAYDAKAIVGFACKYEYGEALKHDQFHGGEPVKRILEETGFRVEVLSLKKSETKIGDDDRRDDIAGGGNDE